MAPVASLATAVPANTGNGSDTSAESYPRPPLQLSGTLDKYPHHESTPVIGREYPTIQLKELLDAPNSDELLRELAIVGE